MTRFDAIVIGAGQAGPSLARRLAAAGREVAIVERDQFGGTCVNTGCIPTKTLVASAQAAHVARRGPAFGVVFPGAVGFDLARAKARADAVVGEYRRGVETSLRETERCTVIRGHARFVARDTVQVGDDTLAAPRIFINVGGRARISNLDGLDSVRYLTNASMLALDALPQHLIVIGGGPVGLEFAQMYRRFGAEVTIVEMAERLFQGADPDVSATLRTILEREGVKVRLGAECIALAPGPEGVTVSVSHATQRIDGTHVLLATGRRPNTDDLGLDRAGVAVGKHGYITVDDQLHTSVPGIWALGECNGHGAYTHTAYNDYEVVAANLFDGEPRRITDRIPAYALYTDPPLGQAGMTLTEARHSGRPHLVAQRPMTRVGRAIEKDEMQGFMRAIVDAQTHRIVGATILGTGGDEAIHALLYAMYAGATARTITHAMGIHPTVCELLPTLLGELRPLT